MIVYCTVLAPCVSSCAAFAAYKRFGRRPKPWRRGGFADPERSDTEGGAALLGGETQKERHLLKADVFLFGASVLIAFTLINSNKIEAQRSGSQLERRSKGAGG